MFSVVGYRDGKWPIFGYTTGIESAVFDIKVELDPTGVSFATTGKTMRVGSTSSSPSYTVTPTGASTGNRRWTSSKPSVASVNASTGEVSARQPGTTTITLTLFNNVNAQYTLTVTGPTCYITGAGLSKSSISLNKSITFTAKAYNNKTAFTNKLEIYNNTTGNKIYDSGDYVSGAITWIGTAEGRYHARMSMKDNATCEVTERISEVFRVTELAPERYADSLAVSPTTISLGKPVKLSGVIGALEGATTDYTARVDVISLADNSVVATTGDGKATELDFTAADMGMYKGVLYARCAVTGLESVAESSPFEITEMVPETKAVGLTFFDTFAGQHPMVGESLSLRIDIARYDDSQPGSYKSYIDVRDVASGRILYNSQLLENNNLHVYECVESGLLLELTGYVECLETHIVTKVGSGIFQILNDYDDPLYASSVELLRSPVVDGIINIKAHAMIPYVWRINTSGTQGGCLYAYDVYEYKDGRSTCVFSSNYTPDNICTFSIMGDYPEGASSTLTSLFFLKVFVFNENGIVSMATGGTSPMYTSAIVSNQIRVTSITFPEYHYSLFPGESIKLQPTVKPDNASYPQVFYQKNNGDFRCINLFDDGTVTALAPGEIIIFASARDHYIQPKYAYIRISVVSLDEGVITLPASLNEIGAEAFKDSSLNRVRVPDGVTVIGERAFSGCKLLERIVIPSSVTSIGADVFEGCEHSFFTVFCEADSAAYDYCIDNQINYRTVDLTP